MQTRPKAILFGAIGTLAETSELQRESYNAAFRDAGLDWQWHRTDYLSLLETPGGTARIAAYAEAREEDVDAEAVHDLKVRHFEVRAREGLTPRPGVTDIIAEARDGDIALAFVTTTGRRTIDLMRDGLAGKIDFAAFDFIGHRDLVEAAKPASDIYRLALRELGIDAGDAMAIEDTPESAQAALDAGITCIGFPGVAAADRIFPDGVQVRERLSPALLDLDHEAPSAA